MQTLSYQTLSQIGYQGYVLPKGAPEKVLQFGEGNFLRAFVDYFFDLANERAGWNGKVVLVQPTARSMRRADAMNAQDCLYTVYVRGKQDGMVQDKARVISACSRCLNPYRKDDYDQMMQVATSDDLQIVVSNATEAGITYDPSCRPEDCPAASFPAKLAQVLHARWQAGKPGVIVLSCELIDHNGAELLKIVKQHACDWGWGEDFQAWLGHECTFCTTLVDSIVPGAVRDQAEVAKMDARRGYHDDFADVREPFQMWGIEGDDSLEDRLPFKAAGLEGSIFVTPDVSPYKLRKVRILNGAHTGFVPGAWLAGFNIVRDCMEDKVVSAFMNQLLNQEVIPTLEGRLERADLESFAGATLDRFDNPFIDHQLLSICLNSTSKWRTRDLPTLLEYSQKFSRVPSCLVTSLACLIAFYTTGVTGLDEDGLHLTRGDGTPYVAVDDRAALEFFYANWNLSTTNLVHETLANAQLWGYDLTQVPSLEAATASALDTIRTRGTRTAFSACFGKEH